LSHHCSRLAQWLKRLRVLQLLKARLALLLVPQQAQLDQLRLPLQLVELLQLELLRVVSRMLQSLVAWWWWVQTR
jgi:hypothetical protein